MKKQFTCIVCPNGCEIEAEVENGQVISVTGHTCPRGEQYVRQELTAPRRTIASSVLVKGDPEYRFDVLEIRHALDGTVAWHAAIRATPEDRDRLRESYEHTVALHGHEDPMEEARADASFHLAIAEASHNLVLAQVTRALFDLLQIDPGHFCQLGCDQDQRGTLHEPGQDRFGQEIGHSTQPSERCQQQENTHDDGQQTGETRSSPGIATGQRPDSGCDQQRDRRIRADDHLARRAEKRIGQHAEHRCHQTGLWRQSGEFCIGNHRRNRHHTHAETR
jgi:hypothetical protein